MTGPDFALAVLTSLIAAAIYDMLRNPPPPVFQSESNKLTATSAEIKKSL
jgi:hypothetical protein